MPDHGRKGFVLIVVILVLLAVTAVGHTLLTLTMSELSVAEARWALLTRRLAAEAGMASVSMDAAAVELAATDRWVSFGAGRVPPRALFERTALRLSRELLLVRSEGSMEGSPGVYGRVGMFWGMDPVARVAAARAVVETEGYVTRDVSSGVSVAEIVGDPAPWVRTTCDPYREDLDTLSLKALPTSATLVEDARVETGQSGSAQSTDPPLPSLGLLGHAALLEGADLRTSGRVSPAPVTALGGCDVSVSDNWGSPLDLSHPCYSYAPVVASEGSLVMDGGQGQGVLLLVGDATFEGRAQYYGLVIVAGELTVRGGSEIHGLVRARGSVYVSEGSVINGSACAALVALDAAIGLQGLFSVPGGAWPDPR